MKSIARYVKWLLCACLMLAACTGNVPGAKAQATRSEASQHENLKSEDTRATKPTEASSQDSGDANDFGSPEVLGKAKAKQYGASTLDLFQVGLTLAVLVFGLVIVFLQYKLLSKRDKNDDTDVVRVFASTIILIGALVFITAGYSSQQSAPALGLFGTIAGYILGRSSGTKPAPTKPASEG